jgi:hypothetical protein
MDPLSIAVTTAGFVSLSFQLLGGCVKGFVLLTTAQNLGKDASTIVCMLNLQEIQLIDWARRAGLLTGDGSLDPRLNPKAVEEALRQIKHLLEDTEHLRSRYNLSLVQQKPDGYRTKAVHDPNKSDKSTVFSAISHETRDDILRRAGEAQKTNFAKRMWWAAVDKEKIEHLVTDVRSFIRELWNLIKPLQYDSMASAMETILANTIKLNTGFDQLVAIRDSINAIQGKLEANNKQDLRELATTAELKAAQVALAYTDSSSHVPSLPTLPKRYEVLKKLDHLLPRKLNAFSPMGKDSTRGLAVYDGDKVFIEWKSTTPAMRSKLLPRAENLAALLNIPKAETFQSLTCRGLLEDDQKLGFVYHNPVASQLLEEPKSLLNLSL